MSFKSLSDQLSYKLSGLQKANQAQIEVENEITKLFPKISGLIIDYTLDNHQLLIKTPNKIIAQELSLNLPVILEELKKNIVIKKVIIQ